MTLDARADTQSCTLRISGTDTWESAEAVATECGLTLGYLVDIRPGRTIGETLAAPAWLPPLWPPHTARGACIALTGMGADAAEYTSVVSPRTASGPDLRSFFLEAGGAFGAVTAATLRCEPMSAVTWLRPTSAFSAAAALQSVVNRFGSVVTVHGDTEGIAVRVREGSRLAGLAVRALTDAGFRSGTPPVKRWKPRMVAVLPWDAFEAALQPVDGIRPQFLAAGPTHVAVGRDAGADERSAATQWARELVAGVRSIGRVVPDVGGQAATERPGFGEVVP